MIVEYIIPRNVIISRGAAEVDNHISRDDIFDYHPLRECNIYFIIPNRTLDPLFSTVCFLLDLPWSWIIKLPGYETAIDLLIIVSQ